MPSLVTFSQPAPQIVGADRGSTRLRALCTFVLLTRFRAFHLGVGITVGLVLAVASGDEAAAAVDSEAYAWRSVKIHGGGFVTGVIFHPTERDLIYARTDVGGAYRWLPAKEAWLPLNDDLARDQSQRLGVLSLALDPNDRERVYLLCGQYLGDWAEEGALMVSTDRGSSWTVHPLPFNVGGNEDGRAAGERLVVDPLDGRMLWLGSNDAGLWRSSDRGATWARVKSCPVEELSLVAIAPVTDTQTAPPEIYVGASGRQAGIWRSNDQGASWSKLRGPPGDWLPNHIVFGPIGAMYVSYANHPGPNGMTDGAVWKLNRASNAWDDVTPLHPAGGDRFGYGAVSASTGQPGVVVAVTNDRWTRGDEIFRSGDGGESWQPLWRNSRTDAAGAQWVYWHEPPEDHVPHWMGDIDIDPFNPDRVLFVSGAGIWGTNDITPEGDARILWTFLTHGLEETVPQWLLSPSVGAPLVSAIADVAGFRHDDLERSPPAGMHQPARGSSFSIEFAEHTPEFFVRTQAGGSQRGFFSRDGARTWEPFASIPPTARDERGGRGALAVSADARGLVWIPKGGRPYFSVDNGATWTVSRGGPVDPGEFVTTVPVADREDGSLFYIYDFESGRVYVSADRGKSFAAAGSLPPNGWPPRAVPGRRGHVWFPAETGLFVTRDAGGSFIQIDGVEGAYAVGFGRPVSVEAYPTVFLSGIIDGKIGLFRSDDAGGSWVRINDDQHQFGWITTLTGDPRVYGRVYIGTGGRGILYGEPSAR